MTDEWRVTTLAELAHWHGGLTPSMKNRAFWEGGSIPWISSKEVSAGVLSGTEKAVTRAALESTSLRLVQPGSVVVVVRSGILLHTLPVAYVPFATTVNQDVKVASPKVGVDARFLAYLVESLEQEILSKYRKTGTTVQSINVPALLAHSVTVPSQPVQRRIADLMGHLDTHLANLQTEHGALDNSTRALRHEIFSNLDDPSVDAGTKFELLLGRQKSARQSVGEHVIPYIRAANISDDGLKLGDVQMMNFDPAEQTKYGLEAGDVLLVEGGTVGLAATWGAEIDGPVGFDKHVIRLRSRVDASTSAYALQWAKWCRESGAFDEQATGITIRALGFGRASAMPVPDISVEDQVRLMKPLTAAEVNRAALQREASGLKTLRQKILSSLLSGDSAIPPSYDELLGVG